MIAVNGWIIDKVISQSVIQYSTLFDKRRVNKLSPFLPFFTPVLINAGSNFAGPNFKKLTLVISSIKRADKVSVSANRTVPLKCCFCKQAILHRDIYGNCHFSLGTVRKVNWLAIVI